ncbi:2-succinyl-5-enolpyruvyl-6-hydroxy-3-cyclohexene-1-carboxylic-acid synthase [Granulicoccus phenolivorans]|uniref:2-succinyl-5-enolpyruvyl-6-hydroxy-3- cyclohexene-1-carboxylic-acid synthase n=1 Tax=Granulicoccus phenolivorans TaxID=266854 RepID=UPI00041BFE2E|nr:2-succinyl-5-enolpyruvyl-6-hydroxy-3-cyclohexene-1-carboxylic-acid synthase [Granulicoccus phenolivorans]
MSATECARTIVESLLGAGVAEAVLAPGSRSAPLAYALAEAAHGERLRLHVRIDERSAGFLALGLAKASGRVVPVVTTSGTAVGNLLPAVMEAHHSGIRLLVLSADRPVPLLESGANQTTRQHGIFGDFLRGFGQVASAEGTQADWHYQVTRLLGLIDGTRTDDPGPGQLNCAFTPPLVPDRAPWPHVPATVLAPRRLVPDPVVLEPGPHTLLIAGDASVAAGAAATEGAVGVPLIAEPSSNARHGAALRTGRLLLETDLGQRIDRVVVFGHPTLSRPVSALLSRPDLEIIVVSDRARWAAPGRRVHRVVDAVQIPFDRNWRRAWTEADAELSGRLDQALGGGLTGPSLAAAVQESVAGHDGVLVAGSSNPIRDLDLAPVPAEPVVTYANRGLAGIDGTVSTAAGIALAAQRPVTALVGDVTFLHEAGGLLIGPGEPRPDLRIVVANDDGGSIFATLEQGAPEYAASFERVFATPHGADLAAVCAGYGVAYQRAATSAEVAYALARPVEGLSVLEVPIGRTDRRALDQRIRSLVTGG